MKSKRMAETIADAIRLLEKLNQQDTLEYHNLVRTWEAMRNSKWTVYVETK